MRIDREARFEQRWLYVVKRRQIPRGQFSHVVNRGRLRRHLNMTRTFAKDTVDKEARMTHVMAFWNSFCALN